MLMITVMVLWTPRGQKGAQTIIRIMMVTGSEWAWEGAFAKVLVQVIQPRQAIVTMHLPAYFLGQQSIATA
jgi:hypothetical protein